MEGLQKFLFKILPIITLVCFVSLGILTVFNNPELTYINKEYMNKETNELYVNPTEEQKENSYSIYTFDMQTYANNIDQDILKRSVEHTITLSAYEWTLEEFNDIWQDGYQIFDVSKTIANGIVLIINTIILPINILLVPIRIIAGILLTGMSLIGININNGIVITPMLTFLVDRLAIPFIAPNTIEPSEIANQRWQFYENINEHWNGNQTIEVDFIIEQDVQHVYDKIEIEQYSGSHIRMRYHIKNGSWTKIFDSGRTGNAWYNNYNKNSHIKLLANNNLTQQQETTITTFLSNYGQLLN